MRNAIIIDKEPELYIDRLRDRFPDIVFRLAATPDELTARLAEAPAEFGFGIGDQGFTKAGQRIVSEQPSVRFFQVGGSGYDHMLPFARPDVTVCNCAGVLARHLSETVTGAILAINGKFFDYRDQQLTGDWRPLGFRPLAGQTLLVVGLGAIGGWVAHNAKALGMKVLATRAHPAPHPHCDEVHGTDALDDLLPRADYVSLHVRLNDRTRHLMNARTIALMKRGTVLVNTARGGCVETSALLAALASGHLRAAYLDVFEEEPLPANSPLWTTPNLFATPHCADMINGWQVEFADFFAANLERYLVGESLANVVHGPANPGKLGG
ncbi:MAG: D-2-hydroxyacid dehydrogenase [Rhizobiales bacterium]|nr:D-2-hydroxyacid dehydrogenase [Hyphomicrobiales bacterium]